MRQRGMMLSSGAQTVSHSRMRPKPGSKKAARWRQNAFFIRRWRAAQELHFRQLGLVQTLEDMSDEKKRALEEQYGCKILPPRPAREEEEEENNGQDR